MQNNVDVVISEYSKIITSSDAFTTTVCDNKIVTGKKLIE